MTWPEGHRPWFDLGEEIRNTAVRIISTVDIKYGPNELHDPVVYAATLLFRTLSSCQAVLALAERGDLVNANIIARSCVENVLWLRGLHQRGIDFAQDILGDGFRAEASLAELVLALPDISLDKDVRQIASDQIKAKTKTRIDVGKITSSEAASMDYTVFRMISNSYAHPSLQSLSHHVVRDPLTGAEELTMEPETAPAQLLWTLFVAAGAVVTATGLFLETFPMQEHDRFSEMGHGTALADLANKLQALGRKAGIDGSGKL